MLSVLKRGIDPMLRDDEGRPKSVTRLEAVATLVAILAGVIGAGWTVGGALIANHDNVMQAKWDIQQVKDQEASDRADLKEMKTELHSIYNWLYSSPGGIKENKRGNAGASLP